MFLINICEKNIKNVKSLWFTSLYCKYMTVFINEEKNEVFRTSDFVLVLCFVVLIIELTSFCNFCFIILVEVIVVKSANGFFYVRCVIKKFVMNLHFIFHIASALYQPSINFSHRAFIPLAYIGVSSWHMMKYEKGYVLFFMRTPMHII